MPHDDDCFSAERGRLRAVAYRILGSATEADDAVQESWIRLHRTDTSTIDNLPGWLTTVTARICLDMLRSRKSNREEHIEVPDTIAGHDTDPESRLLLADSVGDAMLVVLGTLNPAERVAFVLHDMFAIEFDEIAVVLDRSNTAVRQLASRARRRVRQSPAAHDSDLSRRTALVEAFLDASRNGDLTALLGLLAPDVVLHTDSTVSALESTPQTRGAEPVAAYFRFKASSARAAVLRAAIVGAVIDTPNGVLLALEFGFVGDKIVDIHAKADPGYLAELRPMSPSD